MANNTKRLVIIGGTSGIGLATAKLAAKQNIQLVVTGFKGSVAISKVTF